MVSPEGPSAPHGWEAGRSTVSPTVDGWADPTILGWLAFGVTAILAGVSFTKFGGVWETGTTVFQTFGFIMGGAILILAGIIALRKGYAYSGSASVLFGAFFLIWTEILTQISAGTPGVMAGAMWFAIVWALVTFAFLLSAPKQGVTVTLLILIFWIGLILLAFDYGTVANVGTLPGWFGNAIGLDLFVGGLIAWYLATARLTNATYGRRLFPT